MPVFFAWFEKLSYQTLYVVEKRCQAKASENDVIAKNRVTKQISSRRNKYAKS
ncbi:hypothetical protein QF049_001465 [Paenibacillus sp. W4I10]|nr:hypothetical protein [Paenibacillus sp. W4I10]